MTGPGLDHGRRRADDGAGVSPDDRLSAAGAEALQRILLRNDARRQDILRGIGLSPYQRAWQVLREAASCA